MITFILLFVFAVIGLGWWIVSIQASKRNRGQSEPTPKVAARPEETRAPGPD